MYRRIPVYPSIEVWRWRSCAAIRATIPQLPMEEPRVVRRYRGKRLEADTKQRTSNWYLMVKTPRQICRDIHATRG